MKIHVHTLASLPLGILVACLFLASGSADAETTYTFTDTTGGVQTWTDGANWSGGVAPSPASGDTVAFSVWPQTSGHTRLDLEADRTAEIWDFGTVAGSTYRVFFVDATGDKMIFAGTNPTLKFSGGNTTYETLTLSCELAGTSGLTVTNTSKTSGVINFNNPNNTFSGGFVFSGGSGMLLSVAGDGSFGDAGNSLTFNNSLSLNLPAGTYARSMALNNNALMTMSGGAVTITGAVTGSGGISTTNTSTSNNITLSSTANTFTGPITLRADSSQQARITVNSLADGANPITMYAGNYFDQRLPRFTYGAGATTPLVLSQRQFVIAGGGDDGHSIENANTDPNNTVTINTDFSVTRTVNAALVLGGVNTGDNTIAGVIPDGASSVTSLKKQDAGKWILAGTNTYTGATTVSAGLLEIADSGTLGSGNNYAGNISIASTSSGTLKFNSTANQTLSGVISGAGALIKDNSGILTLTNDNSYTSATTVNGGTLAIGGSGDINQSSGITVAAGASFVYNSLTPLTLSTVLNGTGTLPSQRATLGGTQTINVAVTLDSLGDVLSPGNSPGILPFGTGQTWTSYTYEWEVNDWAEFTAGTDFDRITINGTLTLDGSSYALDILSLTPGDVPGEVFNFAETDNSWTILTTTGGITGFEALEWDLDTTGFANADGGTWALAPGNGGFDLVLTYTAIPEPSTMILAGLGLAGLTLRRRRRSGK